VDKYQNKYRIKTTRLQSWDYGANAPYFVTICTANRKHFFGQVLNGEMQLSEIGRMAESFWLAIPEHFPFVQLDAFVIMPNHVHGIIVINKDDRYCKDTKSCVSTVSTKNQFGPQSKNLASIVRGFKIGVKKYATMHQIEFAWQSLYHDHIIRNDIAYQRIHNYILNNPAKWGEDKFHK
jgi:putative transposase